MSEDQNQLRLEPSGPECGDIFDLLPALVEGSLSYARTVRVVDHLRACPHCARMHAEFRAFLLAEAEQPAIEPVRQPAQREQPRQSPYWAEWQDRLNRWLDVVFPSTVLRPAYRSASISAATDWERAARKQSESPLLASQRGDVQLTMHAARGLVYGWVTSADGEPLYPMLLTLVSDHSQESVLTQPDGTFQMRWDPEASAVDCQSPAGLTVRFPLPTGD